MGESRKKIRRVPNSVELLHIYKELLQKPNVHGCYIGRKSKAGKLTSELALICGVSQKNRKSELSQAERIPSSIQWLKNSSKPRTLPTDVVESSDRILINQSSIVGPGDRVVRVRTGKGAALGMAMLHPEYGRVVTTAGHLFPKQRYRNEEVIVKSGDSEFQGVVVKKVISSDSDYALIQVSDPEVIDNLYKDVELVGPFHTPNEMDIHKKVYVLTPVGRVQVICKGINGYFNGPEGIMQDLILTTWGTYPGDSGSCLVDKDYALWGLLVGSKTIQGQNYSVFAPAYIPATREKAQLL